jgi:hypothetical protein
MYPVTYEEKIAVLKRCQELLRKDEADSIGGIHQYALSLVIEEFKKIYAYVPLEHKAV